MPDLRIHSPITHTSIHEVLKDHTGVASICSRIRRTFDVQTVVSFSIQWLQFLYTKKPQKAADCIQDRRWHHFWGLEAVLAHGGGLQTRGSASQGGDRLCCLHRLLGGRFPAPELKHDRGVLVDLEMEPFLGSC
jgi:hypothetical protein